MDKEILATMNSFREVPVLSFLLQNIAFLVSVVHAHTRSYISLTYKV